MSMEEGATIGLIIQRAIEDGLTLEIEYAKSDFDKSKRIISDVTISDEYGVGYISAFCHMRQDNRTFKLSRIVDARIIPGSSQKRERQLYNYVFDASKPIFNLYGDIY